MTKQFYISIILKLHRTLVLKISHASLRKTIELDSFSRRDFSRLITQLLQFGLSCSAVHSVDSKQLLQLLNSVLWSTHSVANRSRIFKYLVIVAPWQSFVPKEVNFLMTTIGHILEAERFVPACWKAVDGDLSTLGKLKAQVTKLLLKLCLESISNTMLLIIPGKLLALFIAAASPHRTQVDQSCPEFHKCTPLCRKGKASHIGKGKVDQLLAVCLSKFAQNA